MKKKQRRQISLGDVFSLSVNAGDWMIQTVGKYRHSNSWVVRVLALPPPDPFDCEEKKRIKDIPDLYLVTITCLELDEREGNVRFIGNADLPLSYQNGLAPVSWTP
jgi:hypothetical protein